jgi:hypothetical protein
MPPLLAALALVAAADPPAGVPLFVVHSTAPKVSVGTLAKLDAQFGVVLASPDATVPAGQLVALRRADAPRPPFPTTAHIRLANGDTLRIRSVVAATDLTLAVEAALGDGPTQTLGIPITALSAVWFTPAPTDTPTDPSRYPWFDITKKKDALLLRNGDVIRGTFEKLTGEDGDVRFKPADEKTAVTHPRATVTALALDPTLARVRLPKGPFARVVTADGSRVSAATVTCDGHSVEVVPLTGGKLTLPVTDVIAVDVFQGKATYLSDLKPKAVKEEPFGGVAWPWVADRSVKGNPLRLKTVLGEEVFDKGLGLHSKTTLTYDLAGKYRRFEATVGLDVLSGRRGAVDVRVLVDGKEHKLDDLTGLTTAAGVKVLAVDVSKAKELMLVVDYGPGGDVQDDVNLVDARLVE